MPLMIPEHKSRTLFKSHLLRVVDYRCRGTQLGRLPEEWCAHHEIVLPRSGLFIRHDPDEKVVVDANQILFFNGEQPYQISHPVAGGDRSTIFVLQPSALLDLLGALDPGIADHPDRPFERNHVTVESGLRLVQYWLLQLDGIQKAEPLEVEEMVLVLIGEALRSSLGRGACDHLVGSVKTMRAQAELVERVKLVLGERFRESLHLDQITGSVYSSPYHLCRVFKRVTGLSIHRYLQNLRLAASLEHLAERPQAPLSTIALELGFASHNHFSTVFRSKFGAAPSEFRRRLRGHTLQEMSKILEA